MKKEKLFIGKDKKYYFALEDKRGNVLLRSQGYSRKDSAEKGLDSVKKNVKLRDSIKRNQSASGKYYFNVVAKNGEIVATSPVYHSKTGREGVIKSISS